MSNRTQKSKESARQRRLRSAQLVSRIGQVFASNKSLDTSLLAIVNLIRTTLDLERCSVLLLNRERGILTLAAAAGIPEKFWAQVEIPVGEGISGRVVFERKPVFVEDISQSEFAHAAHHERYSTKSFISVPIMVSGDVVGVLNANSRSDADPLGREEMDLLVAIAGFIGLGISNAQLSERCEERSSLFRAAMDAVQCGAIIVDRGLAIQHMNNEACRWLRLGGEAKFLGKSLLDLWPQLEGTETFGRLREALANGLRCSLVETLSFPTGLTGEVEVFLSPMVVRGDQRFALLAFHDLVSSAQVDSYKSQFLSLLAHELRTPSAALQAASDLLLGSLSDSQCSDWAKLLRIVSSNSRRLLTVVNSLLDVYELERGTLVLDKHDVRIDELLEEVVSLFESDAEKKKISIKLSSPPILAHVDGRRFTQIISAIVDNAIKYSPQATTVEVKAVANDAQQTFDVSVRDYGPGLPANSALRDAIRFQPGEPLPTRSSGGLGIGLYLARALATLHGGEVVVQNAEGGGTLVMVHMPMGNPSS